MTLARVTRTLAVAAAVCLSATLAQPAAAEPGLDVRSESVYTVDPKNPVVRGSITFTMTNETPSSGNTYYYWDHYAVPIPKGSHNVVATSRGAQLSVQLRESDYPSEVEARISLPSRLMYGNSRTITLTFDVPGAPPRSTNETRVGRGYASFAVIGPGDPGQMTVKVVVPEDFTFDSTFDDFEEQDKGATTVYTADTVPDKGWFWAIVSARNPKQVDAVSVKVGQHNLTLESYPDDKEWATFVGATMKRGIPVLEKLTGTAWPGQLEKVREDSSVRLHGIGGYFDTTMDEIVIGEDMDTQLLYHEMSHAWVNGSSVSGRWLYEGLAEYLSHQALAITDQTTPLPAVRRDAKNAKPLLLWEELRGEDSGDADEYGYPASRYVVTTLLKGASEKEVSALLKTALAGDSVYDRPDGPLHRGSVDWRAFLDLVDTYGGNPKATEIVTRWVLTPAEAKALTGRPKARAAYTAIDTADGTWLPPLGLRSAMATWRFAQAREIAGTVKTAAPKAATLASTAKSLGLDVPTRVVETYEKAETSEDLSALAATMDTAIDAATQVGNANAVAGAGRNPFAAVGARLLDLRSDAARANAAWAEADFVEAITAGKAASTKARYASYVGGALATLGVLLVAALAYAARTRHRRRGDRAGSSGVTPGPSRTLACASPNPYEEGTHRDRDDTCSDGAVCRPVAWVHVGIHLRW